MRSSKSCALANASTWEFKASEAVTRLDLCLRLKAQLLPTSDFIVDIGGTLGRDFLNYVHRRPIVTTHTLVVATQHAVGRPQRKDDVAAVRAVVVAADAVSFGRSQSVEGHRGGRLALRDASPPTVAEPPEHHQGDDDDQEEDGTSDEDPEEDSLRLRSAVAAWGCCGSGLWTRVCQCKEEGRKHEANRVTKTFLLWPKTYQKKTCYYCVVALHSASWGQQAHSFLDVVMMDCLVTQMLCSNLKANKACEKAQKLYEELVQRDQKRSKYSTIYVQIFFRAGQLTLCLQLPHGLRWCFLPYKRWGRYNPGWPPGGLREQNQHPSILVNVNLAWGAFNISTVTKFNIIFVFQCIFQADKVANWRRTTTTCSSEPLRGA